MDHYLDIRVRPDPEFPAAHLMNALFAKLHRALVELRSDRIGVSFPESGIQPPGMGHTLRLHASSTHLERLMATNWMPGMRDHVAVGVIAPVPSMARHQEVRRVQAKSSPDRLRRRQMKRKSWTLDQAREAIPDSAAETLALPFLTVRSHSTSQTFRLFVRQRQVEQPAAGTFNSYGFSPTATLPSF
jgi:CRISPR-associated endonuclease Csy4